MDWGLWGLLARHLVPLLVNTWHCCWKQCTDVIRMLPECHLGARVIFCDSSPAPVP